jgi:hypothetical protein
MERTPCGTSHLAPDSAVTDKCRKVIVRGVDKLMCVKLWVVMTALILSFAVPLSSIAGQQAQEKNVAKCADDYSQLLNIIFPLNEGTSDSSGKEFSLVLRFSQTMRVPDSQINITKYLDGRIEVVMYSVPKPISAYYPDDYPVRNPGRNQIEAVARMIPVNRRVAQKPSGVYKDLITSFADLRFSPRFDTHLHLDGTKYDLWYFAPSHQTHYRITGQVLGSGLYTDEIVKWMNEVYQAVK